MAKKKKAAEASTGSKGASSGARPSAASAATTARTKGAAVELSLASEERVRQLLTTLAATEEAGDATAAEGVTYASRKKAQSALRALYDDLGQLGFQQQHVQAALQHQATQAMPSLEAALHWLCLNVPPDQLPAKFVSRSRAIAAAGGEVKVIAVARPVSPSSARRVEAAAPPAAPPSRAPHPPRQPEAQSAQADDAHKAWIKRYLAQQAEAEESAESSESSEIDDWELTAELHEREKRKAQREAMRRYDPDARRGVVADELRAAKAEAAKAKTTGDKPRQQQAGKQIRELREEMEKLGLDANAVMRETAAAVTEATPPSGADVMPAVARAGQRPVFEDAASPSQPAGVVADDNNNTWEAQLQSFDVEAQQATAAARGGGQREGNVKEEEEARDDDCSPSSAADAAGRAAESCGEPEPASEAATTTSKRADSSDEEDFAAELFDGGLDDSSTYVANAAPPPPPPLLTPWGVGAASGGKGGRKKMLKKPAAPETVLVLPKAHLQQQCVKHGWGAARFTKRASAATGTSGKALSTAEQRLVRYSVTLESVGGGGAGAGQGGRRAGRRAAGPVTFELPDEDDGWENIQDAQNAAATFCLLKMLPNQPVYHTLASPFRELWLKWDLAQRTGGRAREDEASVREEAARSQFIEALLDGRSGGGGAGSGAAGGTGDVGRSTQDECAREAEGGGSWENHEAEEAERALLEQQRTTEQREAKQRAVRDASVRLRDEWATQCGTAEFRRMEEERRALPITAIRAQLLAALRTADAVVVSGETGSGKSTQVPQYVLDDALERLEGGATNIIVTQPRRIAAISLAERVSAERCEPGGPGKRNSQVGYHVRLDACSTSATRLLFCTTGILLRKMQGDPLLSDVSHVVLDEVHERSVQGDFLATLLRDLIVRRRTHAASLGLPPLKVVLMSATLDAELFAQYFNGCPTMHAEGRTFPVQQMYLEDIYEALDYRLEETAPAAIRPRHQTAAKRHAKAIKNSDKGAVTSGWGDMSSDSDEVLNRNYDHELYAGYSEATKRNLTRVDEDCIDFDALESLLEHIDAQYEPGAILVFLPGMGEISKIYERLAATSRFSPHKGTSWLLPLHSTVAQAEQRRIFKVPPRGVRKVVLATNIAETSITVPDVVFVVDTGRVKEMHFDPRRGMTCLVEGWISRASARQRRGRAGRVASGYAFSLYTRKRAEVLMSPFQKPEMVRVPLVELCLQVKVLELGSIARFLQKAIDPPKDEAVATSVDTLREVGALDDAEELTALGHHLAALPVDVRVGKLLLLGASFGCLDPILTIAAALSYKSPFASSQEHRDAADGARLAYAAAGNKSCPLAAGHQSDHLVVAAAYAGWCAAYDTGGTTAARKYASANFLSWETLSMLKEMRQQFEQLLRGIGFVPKGGGTSHQGSWNLNAANVPVIKAVLCAGLYGNVAVMDPSSGSMDTSRPAWSDGRSAVAVHQSSVNHMQMKFKHRFLVFHDKVKTSKVFLRDCTVVSPYALLLFGGPITVKHESGQVLVDGWIPLQSAAQTAVLFKELRGALDALLTKKIKQPQLDLVSDGVVPTIVQLLLDEDATQQQA